MPEWASGLLQATPAASLRLWVFTVEVLACAFQKSCDSALGCNSRVQVMFLFDIGLVVSRPAVDGSEFML